MNKKAVEHLQFALTQYRNNLEGVTDYVEKAKENLSKAKAHKKETLAKIAELEEVLGDDAPPVEKTESQPAEATA